MDSALHAVLLEWYPKDLSGSSRTLPSLERANGKARPVAQEASRGADCRVFGAASPLPYAAPIEFCLHEVGKHRPHAVRLTEIRWALLFHDAIYDARRNDNEARSADWACRVMQELQRPDNEIARVRNMILATAHAAQAETPDEALLLDIDLSILGGDETAFDEYDRAIRVEYEWVPEEAYRAARSNVLQGFLKRDRIFQPLLSPAGRAARRNMNVRWRSCARSSPGRMYRPAIFG